jgi:hypothetical protein
MAAKGMLVFSDIATTLERLKLPGQAIGGLMYGWMMMWSPVGQLC